MKKTFLVMIITVLLLSCNFKSIPSEFHDKLFLLKENETTISINYHKFFTREICRYKINPSDVYCLNQDKLAILNVETLKLEIFSVLNETSVSSRIPEKINPRCLSFFDNNIFIGGVHSETQQPIGIQLNLSNKKWSRLEIPEKLLLEGKSIDDFIFYKDQLIALDYMMSSVLIFYSINEDLPLNFKNRYKLKANGGYEDIYKTKRNKSLLSLGSFSMSCFSGIWDNISIYDLDNMEKHFTISFSVGVFNNIDNTVYLGGLVRDFIITDDFLFIAHLNAGLGKIEISPYSSKDIEVEDYSKIDFISFENSVIIQITQIPGKRKLILTLIDEDDEISYKHKIVTY